MRWRAIPLAVAAVIPSSASATEPSDRALAAHRRGSDVTIDGRLDEPAWTAAEVGDQFLQLQPDEGAAASAPTRFRVLWDQQALYVGIECDEPDAPVLRLARRDRQVDADAVTVVLDTQRDRRTAVSFSVSAAGQQRDSLHYDDTEVTTDWDATWESAVAREPGRWSVEIRVPLAALRIPDGASSFGLNVTRTRVRRHEDSAWRFVPRGVAGVVSQLGTLSGLDGIKPVRAIELRPYVAATAAFSSPGGDGVPSGGWGPCSSVGVSSSALGRACVGLDLKAAITSDLSLVATLNPDFGQVESDQLLLNLSTFESFLPEKRPFFQEGLELFQPPMRMADWGGAYGGEAFQLFYSRRLGKSLEAPALGSGEALVYSPAAQPLAAAKVVGSLGNVSVAVLSAFEPRVHAEVLRGGEPDDLRIAEAAHSGALRVRAPVGEHALVGVTATTRDPIGAADARHSAAGAADLSLFDAERDWTLTAQLAGTHLRGGADELQPDGTWLRDGSAGVGASAKLSKDAGPVTGFVDLDYLSPALATSDMGFQRRANLFRSFAAVFLRDLRTDQVWQSAQVGLSGREIRNAALDLTLHRDLILQVETSLRSKASFVGNVVATLARGDDRELGDGTPVIMRPGWGLVGLASSDPTARLVANGGVFWQKLGPAMQTEIAASVTFRPIARLEAQLDLEGAFVDGDMRAIRGATTVPAGGSPPTPLSAATATEMQRLYLFAPQRARSVSTTLRLGFAVSPLITLQAYAQVFLAGVTYGDPWRAVAMPGRAPIDLGRLERAQPEDEAEVVDSRQAGLNVNLIARWEWRRGSTLYLVYAHRSAAEREPAGGGLDLGQELGLLGEGSRGDTLLFKMDFLLNL